MKAILLIMGILSLAVISIACGPAVGRAVGDVPETSADGDSVGSNVMDAKFEDLEKERTKEINDAKSDLKTDFKEATAMYAKQEEQFFAVRNELDVLKNEMTQLLETDQPQEAESSVAGVDDFEAIHLENKNLHEELRILHTRVVSLEETENALQEFTTQIAERAEEIQYAVAQLTVQAELTSSDNQDIRFDIQTQLDALGSQIHKLEHMVNDFDGKLDVAVSEIQDEIDEMSVSDYPISAAQSVAYENLINGIQFGGSGPTYAFAFESAYSLPMDYQYPINMPSPQNCVGPNALRQCFDNLIPALDLYAPGRIDIMGVTVLDPCAAAEAVYGMADVHGLLSLNRVWDLDNKDYLYMKELGFITEHEYDLSNWAHENIDILKVSYEVSC